MTCEVSPVAMFIFISSLYLHNNQVTTSDFGLQSFKYQGLAIATDDRSRSSSSSSSLLLFDQQEDQLASGQMTSSKEKPMQRRVACIQCIHAALLCILYMHACIACMYIRQCTHAYMPFSSDSRFFWLKTHPAIAESLWCPLKCAGRRHESQETSTGKRVLPDWNLGLGQPLLDLQVDRYHLN